MGIPVFLHMAVKQCKLHGLRQWKRGLHKEDIIQDMNYPRYMRFRFGSPLKSWTQSLEDFAETRSAHRQTKVAIEEPMPRNTQEMVVIRIHWDDSKCKLNICFFHEAFTSELFYQFIAESTEAYFTELCFGVESHHSLKSREDKINGVSSWNFLGHVRGLNQ